MAPQYNLDMNEEDFNKLIRVAGALDMKYKVILEKKDINIIPSRSSIKSNYLEVPSIGLAVSKKNWVKKS